MTTPAPPAPTAVRIRQLRDVSPFMATVYSAVLTLTGTPEGGYTTASAVHNTVMGTHSEGQIRAALELLTDSHDIVTDLWQLGPDPTDLLPCYRLPDDGDHLAWRIGFNADRSGTNDVDNPYPDGTRRTPTHHT